MTSDSLLIFASALYLHPLTAWLAAVNISDWKPTTRARVWAEAFACQFIGGQQLCHKGKWGSGVGKGN